MNAKKAIRLIPMTLLGEDVFFTEEVLKCPAG
jgi:hypothetical protein